MILTHIFMKMVTWCTVLGQIVIKWELNGNDIMEICINMENTFETQHTPQLKLLHVLMQLLQWFICWWVDHLWVLNHIDSFQTLLYNIFFWQSIIHLIATFFLWLVLVWQPIFLSNGSCITMLYFFVASKFMKTFRIRYSINELIICKAYKDRKSVV